MMFEWLEVARGGGSNWPLANSSVREYEDFLSEVQRMVSAHELGRGDVIIVSTAPYDVVHRPLNAAEHGAEVLARGLAAIHADPQGPSIVFRDSDATHLPWISYGRAMRTPQVYMCVCTFVRTPPPPLCPICVSDPQTPHPQPQTLISHPPPLTPPHPLPLTLQPPGRHDRCTKRASQPLVFARNAHPLCALPRNVSDNGCERRPVPRRHPLPHNPRTLLQLCFPYCPQPLAPGPLPKP
jgi:hypothetical protein